MYEIKNIIINYPRFISYKKFAASILSCLLNFNTQSWFGSGSIKEAIAEHAEAYKKVEPEIAENNIEVSMDFFGNCKYTPETPNLASYMVAFKKLENKVMSRSIVKSFLFGLPAGLCLGYDFCRRAKHSGSKYPLLPVLVSLASGMIYSVVSVMHENRTSKKQPYFAISSKTHPDFGLFLKKYDNYFSNLSLNTITRIWLSKSLYYLGGIAGAVGYTAIATNGFSH